MVSEAACPFLQWKGKVAKTVATWYSTKFLTTNLMISMILIVQVTKKAWQDSLYSFKALIHLSHSWRPNNGQSLIFQRQMGKINNQKVHRANCVLENKLSFRSWKDQRKPLKNETCKSCILFSKFLLIFVVYLRYCFFTILFRQQRIILFFFRLLLFIQSFWFV